MSPHAPTMNWNNRPDYGMTYYYVLHNVWSHAQYRKCQSCASEPGCHWAGTESGSWTWSVYHLLIYSLSPFSLHSALWSETPYIFYYASLCSISQSVFLCWVISSGSFFLLIFSQHFWSRKCIKNASSVSWTLKPIVFEGLQGWGGLTSLLG